MSTITNLTYGGLATTPPDDSALDGTLSLSLNAIHEDAALRPVPQPKDVSELLGEGLNDAQYKFDRVFCAHTTNSVENYIVGYKPEIANPSKYGYKLCYARNGVFDVIVTLSNALEVYNIVPVGNTLVVLASTGIHYLLWKNGAYKYLGDHLPEIPLGFKTGFGHTYSEEVVIEFDGALSLSPLATGVESQRLIKSIRDAKLACANSIVAKAFEDRLFIFPFYIRYVVRLYDGSYVMQSQPILVVPNEDLTQLLDISFGSMENGTSGGPIVTSPAKIKGKAKSIVLSFENISQELADELTTWEDIILAVDFFVSVPFFTYNQGESDTNISASSDSLPEKDAEADMRDNGNFYLLKSVSLTDVISTATETTATTGTSANGHRPPSPASSEIKVLRPTFKTDASTISTRPRLEDDYISHHKHYSQYGVGYNSRLNLAKISYEPFSGFNPTAFLITNNKSDEVTTFSYRVELVTEDKTIIVGEDGVSGKFYSHKGNRLVWFYYPSIHAKKMHLLIDGSYYILTLAPHPFLNGSYYINFSEVEALAQENTEGFPAITPSPIIPLPNKIYTSEVNNPFHFPLLNIYTVGTGEVMGIATAAKALSQGQFGQFPLYAFTSEGVWAMELSATGTYSARQPISRDVCNNPASITQIDSAVLFATARGLMLISGSELIPLTDAIFAPDFHPATQLPHFGNLVKEFNRITGASLDASTIAPLTPFNEFLLNCRISYDYINQRIILFSNDPGIRYAYIYSLKSKLWGMMLTEATNAVPSYPEALATTADGRLLNFSERSTSGTTPVLAVTRPFTVDHSDGLSTIDTIIQRGTFARGHVAQALYGSRDLLNWFVVWSSNNEYLRGMRGTPYKYFRLALISNLGNEESLSGAAIAYNERQRNRLR